MEGEQSEIVGEKSGLVLSNELTDDLVSMSTNSDRVMRIELGL